MNQNENNPNAMMKDDNEIPDLENDLEIAKERREIELLKVKAEKARLMKEIAGCKAQIEMNEMIDDLMTRVAQNEEWLTALTEDKDELSDKLDRFRSEYDNLALKFYLRNRSKI